MPSLLFVVSLVSHGHFDSMALLPMRVLLETSSVQAAAFSVGQASRWSCPSPRPLPHCNQGGNRRYKSMSLATHLINKVCGLGLAHILNHTVNLSVKDADG